MKGQIARYRLFLAGQEENTGHWFEFDSYEPTTEIELPFGPWEVLLQGFSASNNLIARGIVKAQGGHGPNQTIYVGTGASTAVVELRPLETAGIAGTLDLQVTPHW